MKKERLVALAVIALPMLVVFWIATFVTLNHFHDGPFLQDSGWHSAIVWRAGLVPDNPPVADSVPKSVTSFFGVHVSPLVSIFSAASYGYPGERVGWFCLFIGFVFAPLAAAPGLLLGRDTSRSWG